MIRVDIFSGHAYIETEHFKQSNTSETFVKSGDLWISKSGHIVQERENDLFNIKTGVSSNWGDPFKEEE